MEKIDGRSVCLTCVYTQEIDDTFVPAGAGTIGAALIGHVFHLPPALDLHGLIILMNFRTVFGGLDDTKYMPYAARSYLRNGSPSQLFVFLVRAHRALVSLVLSLSPKQIKFQFQLLVLLTLLWLL